MSNTPSTATPATPETTAKSRPVYARETLVSELYGIPVATLRTRRVRSPNAPPFIKVGRCVLYRLRDVEAWIKSEAAKGGAK